MKIKKFLILFLALFFTLTSCNNKEDNPDDNNIETVTKYYQVDWKVEDKIIKTEKVKEGKIPKYTGETPTKESTKENCFIFSRWDPIPTKIDKDTIFTAIFNDKDMYYDVTFDTMGGNPLNPLAKPYGSLIDNLPNATKQGYIFTGWTYDKENTKPIELPYTITSNVTFYASYNKQITNTEILDKLLEENNIDPLQFIPKKLLKDNYIVKDNIDLNNDYKKDTDINTINDLGYLSEWSTFLTKLDEISSMAKKEQGYNLVNSQFINEYNKYIQENPDNQNDFEISLFGYNMKIKKLENEFMLIYNNATSQRLLTLDLVSGNKNGRLDNGENDILKYTIKKNDFVFTYKKEEICTYFHINKKELENDKSLVTAKLIEINGEKTISSTLEINDETATVIGNSTDKFIKEIYDVKTGKPLFVIHNDEIKKVYFNITDVISFNKIKYEPITGLYYINGNILKGDALLNSNYGITTLEKNYINKSLFGNLSVVKHNSPMLYVNETHLDQLKELVETNNEGLTFDLNVDLVNVKKECNDFVKDIEVINKLKESLTKEHILELIGQKYEENTTVPDKTEQQDNKENA